MVLISLTGINGRGNHFFPLLGVLALSPSHGEVEGRLFFCETNGASDMGEVKHRYVRIYARLTRLACCPTTVNSVLARFLPSRYPFTRGGMKWEPRTSKIATRRRLPCN